MNTHSEKSHLAKHILVTAVLAVALMLTSVACSANGQSGGQNDPAANAKAASAALDAGLKAHAAGDTKTATDDYNTVLRYDPTNKFALYNLALIDVANRNYGLAEGKYRLALKTDPAYEPALFNLAILRTTANPKEAISLYQRAVKADPKDAAALLNLGLLLRANGQKAQGDKDVLRAIMMNPKLKDPSKP
jgi:tetratricopeptide (TPR) repeat protein